MTPAAEALVRGIVDAGMASGTREGRMLAQLAARALQAEGLPSPELPPSGPSLSPDAKRMREKRARERAERVRPNGEQTERVPNVRTEGERGRSDLLLEDPNLITPALFSTGAERVPNVPNTTNAFTERSVRTASDDGAFGMTVDSWCQGVSDVTGRPCTRPTHGQQRQLIEAQANHRPVTEEPVAWSRSSAAEYARAHKGQELSTFGYVRWLDSRPIERPSGLVAKAPPRPPKRPESVPERLSPEKIKGDLDKLFGGHRG